MGDTVRIDRRVIKTKRAIRNAFAELLSEKDINEITIKDIADLAEINRKTFYSYYAGVYQVIDEIENEIISAFVEALSGIDFHRSLQNPYEIFKKLTAILNSDMDFYGHLMKAEYNASLVSKIVQALKQIIKASFAEQIPMDGDSLEIVVDYAVAGMVTVYQRWFNSDRQQSIEDISKAVSSMTFSGINGVLELCAKKGANADSD